MAKQQIKKDPDRIWFIVNKILLGIFFLSVLGFAFMLLQNVGVSVDSYEPNNPRFSLNLASLAKTGESFLIFIFLSLVSFFSCIFYTLFLPKKTKWRQLGWIFLIGLFFVLPLLINRITLIGIIEVAMTYFWSILIGLSFKFYRYQKKLTPRLLPTWLSILFFCSGVLTFFHSFYTIPFRGQVEWKWDRIIDRINVLRRISSFFNTFSAISVLLFFVSSIACISYTLFFSKKKKWQQLGGILLIELLVFSPLFIYKINFIWIFVISFIACILHVLFFPKENKWWQLGWIFLIACLAFFPLLVKKVIQRFNLDDIRPAVFESHSFYGDTMSSIDIKDSYYADRIDNA